jgi:hypothetical protein
LGFFAQGSSDSIPPELPIQAGRQPPGLFFMESKMVKSDWHLDRGVSLSHISATVLLVMGGVSAYFGVTERLSVLENQFVDLSDRVIRLLESQRRIDDDQDQDLAEFRSEIRTEMREINAKLDRLIENVVTR